MRIVPDVIANKLRATKSRQYEPIAGTLGTLRAFTGTQQALVKQRPKLGLSFDSVIWAICPKGELDWAADILIFALETGITERQESTIPLIVVTDESFDAASMRKSLSKFHNDKLVWDASGQLDDLAFFHKDEFAREERPFKGYTTSLERDYFISHMMKDAELSTTYVGDLSKLPPEAVWNSRHESLRMANGFVDYCSNRILDRFLDMQRHTSSSRYGSLRKENPLYPFTKREMFWEAITCGNLEYPPMPESFDASISDATASTFMTVTQSNERRILLPGFCLTMKHDDVEDLLWKWHRFGNDSVEAFTLWLETWQTNCLLELCFDKKLVGNEDALETTCQMIRIANEQLGIDTLMEAWVKGVPIPDLLA